MPTTADLLPVTDPLAVLGRDITVPTDHYGLVRYANFDLAASAPCLGAAADAVTAVLPYYASVHRGAGALSQRCTLEYERSRQIVADFLGCGPERHRRVHPQHHRCDKPARTALPAGTAC